MVVRVATVAFEWIEARPVDVQVQVDVQIAPGNVVFNIVGLGDSTSSASAIRRLGNAVA